MGFLIQSGTDRAEGAARSPKGDAQAREARKPLVGGDEGKTIIPIIYITFNNNQSLTFTRAKRRRR